jgi:hypothetical protein
MKFKESIKKPLTTFFVFILGIFAVSGLTYITTVMGAPIGTSPSDGNAFKPINAGPIIQGRCNAINTDQPIRTDYMYTDCKSGNDGLEGSSPLFTNGVLVKTPNASFQITGDLGSSYKYGALYVGCTNDSNIISNQNIRDRCGDFIPTGGQPPAYFYGNINMPELIQSGQTEDKKLCISSSGVVKLCP